MCNTLVVVKYSSKTVPIDRNPQKPVKCIIQNIIQVMFSIHFAKDRNQTTVESKKRLSYIIVVISMIIPVIVCALGSVTRRLVDS